MPGGQENFPEAATAMGCFEDVSSGWGFLVLGTFKSGGWLVLNPLNYSNSSLSVAAVAQLVPESRNFGQNSLRLSNSLRHYARFLFD